MHGVRPLSRLLWSLLLCVVAALPARSQDSSVPATPDASPTPTVAVSPQVPKRVRVSSAVAERLIVHKVAPQYPEAARRERIQGAVQLSAVVGRDGKIVDVVAVSGDPALSKAAIEAVRQWVYKPYKIHDRPVEVDMTITINFNLLTR